MWEPVETLVNAQIAVRERLVLHWRGFLLASVIPGAVAVAALIWMVEAYWASAGFAPGQIAAMISTGAALFYLSSLSIGRLVRIGLGMDQPRKLKALGSSLADTRSLAICFALTTLVILGGVSESLAGRAVVTSFFTAGSDVIARPVLASVDVAILLALYYLLGRLSLFLPAQIVSPDTAPGVIWRATEGHGAILFLVTVAAPLAVLLIIAAPVLWWVGALPWPAPSDFAGTQALGQSLGERLYLVVPLLFLGVLAFWALTAAGLCAAWDALRERGVLPERIPLLEGTKAAGSAE